MPGLRRICIALLIGLLPVSLLGGTVSGDLIKWHPVTVDFAGPTHTEFDDNPNPFLDYRLQVLFTHAGSGKSYDVPGYFAGDGSGGDSGSVWRVRFNPDEAGLWTYVASFRTGVEVAVDLNPGAGTSTSFDGDSGSFSISGTDTNAPGFRKYGRLESIGDYYLKFRDGGYWLKLGTNNPENFLGYDGFDNTPFAWHSYTNHVQDWNSGDPDWDSPYTAGTSNDGRGIIGALNYLDEIGLNSIYFMPMNIGADGKDTWPFASETINRDGSSLNDDVHYDISKLEQWDVVLTHAQDKEIYLHFVLSDKTRENKNELDNATLGPERKLFYRELIARFGYHNGLQWNISEEYNLALPLSPTVIKQFGEYIKAVDPYDMPITVHPHGNTYVNALAPFLGDDWYKIVSVQTWQRPDDISDAIEYFRAETAAAGNPIPVGLDESIGMNSISAAAYRKRIIWDAMFSGGGLEMFKQSGDSTVDDFRVYEQYFDYARIASTFMRDNLPFWSMAPDDELLTGEDGVHGGGEVFTKPGEIYAVFLPSAAPAANLDLSASTDTFEQRWFNPRTGQFAGSPFNVSGGGTVSLGLPPSDTDNDWVVLLQSTTAGVEPFLSNGQPNGLLPAGTAQTSLSVTTNVDATCKYDTVPGTDYAAMPGAFTVTGTTQHSTTIGGLVYGGAYFYYVRCADLGGTANVDDYIISFSVDMGGIAPTGDLARWSLDEGSGTGINDTSGNANNGTLVSNPQWVAGLAGQALRFDGSASHVSIPDSTSLNYQGLAGASVALWFRAGRLGHADDQTLYGHWNSSRSNRPMQILLLPDDRLQCRTNSSNGEAFSTTPAVLDDWMHVVCVWSPSGLQIFINGVLEGADSGVESSLDGNTSVHTLGAREKGGSIDQHFLGDIDDVHIFGQALSVIDVSRLYNEAGEQGPQRSNGAPSGVLPFGTTQTQLTLNTDVAADCRYSAVLDTDYGSMVGMFDSTGAMSHATTMAGLVDGQAYDFYARCEAGGTVNTTDYPISFSIDIDSSIPPTPSGGAPSGALPAGTSQATLSFTTDITANCRYSTTPDTAYSAMVDIFSQTGGAAHQTDVTGLLNGQSYDYFVRCANLAGTPMTSDYAISFSVATPAAGPDGVYYPSAGESLASQFPKTAAEVGLSPTTVSDLSGVIQSGRWALWRHGYLIHVEGDFNLNSDIQSARKTIHAATAGVALQQGLIPSLQQKISVWNTELSGLDADATWFHVLTQASAFDEPAIAPGDLWAYSDENPHQLNRALARVYGNGDYDVGYATVLGSVLLDPIGAGGWVSTPAADGIRLQMDLEDLGRVGLLLAGRGVWSGTRLISSAFVDQLFTKQVAGITPNYDNANDGMTELQVADFPDSPYGLMTWANTDQDLYPAADSTWAVALGVNGHYIVMDPESGVVLAMLNAQIQSVPGNPPGWPTQVRAAVEALQASVAGSNPLVTLDTTPPSAPTGLAGVATMTQVDLTWVAAVDAESGIDSSDILRNLPGANPALIGTVSGATTAFADVDVADNTTYEYRVVARNGSGYPGPESTVATVVTFDAPPVAPQGVSTTAGNGQVTLGWSANGEGDLAGYRVNRATVPGGPYSDVSGLILGPGYVDLTVTNEVPYYYVVTAEDLGGNPSANSAQVTATPTSGPAPVAWWPLDEGTGTVAGDAIGANDGTVVGATWVPGSIASGLQFDGASQRVSIVDTAALDYSSWTGATVALWVKPERLNHPDEQTLYGHWNNTKSQRTMQVVLAPDNRFQCNSNSNNGEVTSTSAAQLGTWVHVACVWTPAGLSIVVDGVLEGTDNGVEGSLDVNAGKHTLGARDKSGSIDQHFLGALDELRIYDGALTVPQLGALAGSGGGNQAPVVDAGVDATIRLPVLTANLDGTVTDDGLPIAAPLTTWSVVSGPSGSSFGDASAVDTTVTFSVAGTYVLQLLANDTELQASDTVTITVEALPVLTGIVVTPAGLSLEPGQAQQYTAAGADQYGDPIGVTATWTATGGTISAGGLYTAGGSFGLYQVTATDGAVNGSTSVTVSGSPPVAEAGGPYTGAEGDTLTVDGSGSSDPNDDIVAWDWDLDNDGQYDDASGETAAYVAGASGTLTIGLQVFDIDGASSTDTAQVTISNVGPTANAGGPYAIDEGQAATLDASGSSDPGNDIVTYEWDLDNDGQYDDAVGVTTPFVGTAPGVYPVGVRVTDADTASSTAATTVTVADVAPGAPAGVTASAGNGQVTLGWSANGEGDLAGYRVNRATVPGGPYSDVSGLILGPGYVDLTVTNEVPYYYVVTAEDLGGNPSANSAQVTATPTSGPAPVAWWPLDEGTGTVAGDAIGANDGTVVGATWVPGSIASGLQFDGASQRVSIVDTAALDYSSWTGATVALWVKPERLNHPDEQTLYGHWNNTKSQRTMQVVLAPDNRFQCNSNSNNGEVTSTSAAQLGTWVHVACVWTPAGLSIVVDGVLEGTDNGVEGSLDVNAGKHTLGARDKSGSIDQHFLGALDELRIYDGALTVPQLGALAGSGGGNQAPVVDAGVDATIRLPVLTANLDGTVTDDGLPIAAPLTTWSVVSGPSGSSFGDASAVDTTVTFSVAGTYVLQLLANDTELQASDTVTITVEALPVLTGIVVTPAGLSLEPGQAQQYTAAGADQYGDPIGVTATWTATGGTISAGGLYTAGGSFGLYQVTATDGAVNGSTSVTVSGSPPVAEAGGPYTGAEGDTLTVDGSGSSDPNDDIVAWDWDLDNDGQYDDASGETAAYVAGASGTLTIGLQVFDIDGASSTDTAQVTISNVGPTANAGGPYAIDEGQAATLDASGSSDPGNDIVTYEWDLDNDGQYDDAVGVTTPFVGTAPGVYPVGVRVTDADTASSTAATTVTVADVAPGAPAGVTASAGNGQVTLGWSANGEGDLAGYRVNRATVPGGPYSDVSGLLVTPGYLDTSVANGVTYYYVITAEDLGGNVSLNSAEVDAMPIDFPAGHFGPYYVANERSRIKFENQWLPDKSTPTKITFQFVQEENGVGNTLLSANGNVWYFSYPDPDSGDPQTNKILSIRLFADVDYSLAEPALTTPSDDMLNPAGLIWNQLTIEWPTVDANTATVTINGVSENVPMGNVAIPGNSDLYLLSRFKGSGFYGDGYLQDVRVSENDNLIHHWKIDDNAITIADYGSQPYPGEIKGPSGGWVLEDSAPANQAPVVDAGVDATIRLPVLTANLDGTVTDDGLPIAAPLTTWSVVSGPSGSSFGDASAVDTTVTFSVAGTYVLQLLANDTELQASDTVTITVEALPVLTGIVVTPAGLSLEPGQAQQYTAAGADQYGDPIGVTATWTATGGTISAGGLYTAGGSFGLYQVTATDGAVNGSTSVTVSGSPPVAEAGGPYTGAEGDTLTVDGSGSSDPNDDIVAWDWDLDNDGQYDDASGETAAYVAGASGTLTIGLQVFDIDGASSTDTAQVTISNVGPTANAGGPYAIDEGQAATLDASGSSDPGNDIVTYEWDLDNDGQYDDAVGVTTPFVGTAPGVYPVGVRVTDADTASSTAATTVTVADVAPGAPAGVTASAGNGQVTLGWSANGEGDLAGYRVNRATVPGGPYSDVSGLLVTPGYLDTSVANGVTYYYVITAEDLGGNPSANSAQVTATPLVLPTAAAFWAFDEGMGATAFDAIGASDGMVMGPTWVAGLSGGALDFDGDDDHVQVANTPALDISGTAITLAAWINPDTRGDPGGSRVISKRTDAGGSDVYAMYTEDNRVQFRLDGASMVSTGTFATGDWVHVAMVYNGVDKRIYVNGVLDASIPETKTDPIDASARPVFIGQREGEGRYFDGRIDDVRIYDVALNATEIAQIAATAPPDSFADITATAGTGGPGDGGHGVMFADVDGDGLPDLYSTLLVPNTGTRVELFHRNLGGSTFVEEAALRGIADLDGGSHGSVWADLDNDGDFDLVNGSTWDVQGTFGFPVGNNVYENTTGFFTDVTPTSVSSTLRETRGVTAVDMDADGDLDLFAVAGPDGLPPNEAYLNDGALQFVPYTAAGDLLSAVGMQGVTDTDYNGDGDVDIIAANRNGSFAILDNDGNGVFTQIDPLALGFVDSAGDGITTADIDNDGDLDMLLVSDGTGYLYDRGPGGTYSLNRSFIPISGYMGGFADLDHDGDLDLAFAGGGTIFTNDGSGSFKSGPVMPTYGNPADPRGIALADIDADGDIDFAVAYKDTINQMIRNDYAVGNWLKVRLIAPNGQRGAFGAKTYIYAAGDLDGTQVGLRESKGNTGYLGQDDPTLHFGLGSLGAVDIRVVFLDGTTKTCTGVTEGQTIVIDSGAPCP